MMLTRSRASCVRTVASSGPPPTGSAGPRPVPKQVRDAALLGTVALASQAGPALAEEDAVEILLGGVVTVIKGAGAAVKAGISTVDTGVKVAKDAYGVAAPYIEQGVKAASPIVEQAAKVTVDVTSPIIQQALPALSEAEKSLEASIKSSPSFDSFLSGANTLATGVDSLVTSASKAVTVATPVASQAIKTVTSSDPSLLGQYTLGALAFFSVAPSVLGLIGGSFRGFAGEEKAPLVLEQLRNGQAILIDIRTQREKETGGVPELPSSFNRRSYEVEFASCDDKRLRGALRDPKGMEAIVTCLQIAGLKGISKGNKIILMDRFGGASRAVAKELARKGFSKVFTVAGGFEGSGGWVQSKLQIKPAATIAAIPAKVGTGSTKSGSGSVSTRTPQKALPAPKASTGSSRTTSSKPAPPPPTKSGSGKTVASRSIKGRAE